MLPADVSNTCSHHPEGHVLMPTLPRADEYASGRSLDATGQQPAVPPCRRPGSRRRRSSRAFNAIRTALLDIIVIIGGCVCAGQRLVWGWATPLGSSCHAPRSVAMILLSPPSVLALPPSNDVQHPQGADVRGKAGSVAQG